MVLRRILKPIKLLAQVNNHKYLSATAIYLLLLQFSAVTEESTVSVLYRDVFRNMLHYYVLNYVNDEHIK